MSNRINTSVLLFRVLGIFFVLVGGGAAYLTVLLTEGPTSLNNAVSAVLALVVGFIAFGLGGLMLATKSEDIR